MKERTQYKEKENISTTVVYENDLAFRYKIIAEKLGVETIPPDVLDWLENQNQRLQEIIHDYTGLTFDSMNLEQAKEELSHYIELFKEQTTNEGFIPFIISFDSLIAPQADYLVQENRMICVNETETLLDPESKGMKGKGNRFGYEIEDKKNGAGKTLAQQIEEIKELLGTFPTEQVKLAIVDGSIVKGKTLLNFLSQLPSELKQQEITAIAGWITESSKPLFQNENIHLVSSTSYSQKPQMVMCASDLVPTLGGRPVAEKRENGTLFPYTVVTQAGEAPLSLDAIMGGDPDQVDLDIFNDALLAELRSWSLQTGYGFWQSLEALAGYQLTWDELEALNGTVKVMLPARLHMDAMMMQNPPSSPKEAVLQATWYT